MKEVGKSKGTAANRVAATDAAAPRVEPVRERREEDAHNDGVPTARDRLAQRFLGGDDEGSRSGPPPPGRAGTPAPTTRDRLVQGVPRGAPPAPRPSAREQLAHRFIQAKLADPVAAAPAAAPAEAPPVEGREPEARAGDETAAPARFGHAGFPGG